MLSVSEIHCNWQQDGHERAKLATLGRGNRKESKFHISALLFVDSRHVRQEKASNAMY